MDRTYLRRVRVHADQERSVVHANCKQWVIQLDEFEDIVEKNISIKLVLADPASSDHIKFKYAQCEKANCESLGAPVDIQTEFQPKCKKIGDTGNTCVLLVTVTNTKYKEVQGEGNQATPGHSAPAQPAEILGLLPYIPLIYEEIEVNKHHTGVLHNGEEARFRIPKEKLEVEMASDSEAQE